MAPRKRTRSDSTSIRVLSSHWPSDIAEGTLGTWVDHEGSSLRRSKVVKSASYLVPLRENTLGLEKMVGTTDCFPLNYEPRSGRRWYKPQGSEDSPNQLVPIGPQQPTSRHGERVDPRAPLSSESGSGLSVSSIVPDVPVESPHGAEATQNENAAKRKVPIPDLLNDCQTVEPSTKKKKKQNAEPLLENSEELKIARLLATFRTFSRTQGGVMDARPLFEVKRHHAESGLNVNRKRPATALNIFIFYRRHLQPALQLFYFKTISAIISLIWADQEGCSIFNHAPLYGWYDHLLMMRSENRLFSPYLISEHKREKTDRRLMRNSRYTSAIALIQGCLYFISGSEVPEEIKEYLRSLTTELESSEGTHSGYKNRLLQELLR